MRVIRMRKGTRLRMGTRSGPVETLDLKRFQFQTGSLTVLLVLTASTSLAFLPPLRDGFVSFTHGAARVVCRSTKMAATATTMIPTPPEVVAEVIPEGHRGLHEFLYGDAEDHGASSVDPSGVPVFSRDTAFGVNAWLEKFGSSRVAAVYAVLDRAQNTRFVGVTRNLAVALKGHLKAKGDEAVDTVRIQAFRFPKREEMAAFQEEWLKEMTSMPEGNQAGSNGWASTIREAAASAMSAEDRVRYDDLKTKMRTAMADPKLLDELDELEDDTTGRRERLMAAVEQEDWSAVINAQTLQTVTPRPEAAATPTPEAAAIPQAAAAAAPEAVVSPFDADKPSNSPPPPQQEDEDLPLTNENVDKVLDSVRPYLISDGGNIEVVSIDLSTRAIYLRLQGACGSCPSSTTTMKMGVERVLREKFRDLGTVEAVNPTEPVVSSNASSEEQVAALRAAVEAKLQEILPAIKGLGGVASVDSVSATGQVVLAFRGPDKVRLGLEYAVKSIKGVAEVSSKPPDN